MKEPTYKQKLIYARNKLNNYSKDAFITSLPREIGLTLPTLTKMRDGKVKSREGNVNKVYSYFKNGGVAK